MTAINSLGYGVVGWNVYKELAKLADVTLWYIGNDITPPTQATSEDGERVRADIAKQDDLDYTAPILKIWHEFQLAERIGKGPLTALSFCEVSELNTRRITHLSSADKLVLPSEWMADITRRHLPDKSLCVVPMGVDRTVFNEFNNNPPPHVCTFFNCGKWEVRKGHDILHRAFSEAFPTETDVQLLMMTENPFLSDQQKNYWEGLYRQDRRIKTMARVTHQQELAEIMSKVDCGVFPARAEGWNLEALELMSMGKELIITNYSAHTQFCNSDNARLIDIVEEEPMYDGLWFKGDCGSWASLEGQPYDQLVAELRSVYKQWQDNPSGLVNTAGIETAQKSSWETTAKQLLEATLEC